MGRAAAPDSRLAPSPNPVSRRQARKTPRGLEGARSGRQEGISSSKADFAASVNRPRRRSSHHVKDEPQPIEAVRRKAKAAEVQRMLMEGGEISGRSRAQRSSHNHTPRSTPQSMPRSAPRANDRASSRPSPRKPHQKTQLHGSVSKETLPGASKRVVRPADGAQEQSADKAMKMHDSAGSIVQKKGSRQGPTSAKQQQGAKVSVKSRRSASWDFGARDLRLTPRTPKTSRPRDQVEDKPKPIAKQTKRVASVQQQAGLTFGSERDSEPLDLRLSASYRETPSPDLSVFSPEPSHDAKISGGSGERTPRQRLADSRFDLTRTAPDLQYNLLRTPTDMSDIMQSMDIMRSGDIGWEFLQSADVRWDVDTDEADRIPTPGLEVPWADSGRHGVKHRPATSVAPNALRAPVSFKEGTKQGPIKSFIGKMLAGCCRPQGFGDTDGEGYQPRRRKSMFPRQRPGRQSATLQRFTSRQKFMVNLIEEGRFHPASNTY